MRYFPLFIDTQGADILFVGGTEGVLAKLRLWLKTQARLVVVALEAEADIVALAKAGRITLEIRAFAVQDLANKRALIVSTGSPVADHLVSWLARQAGLVVNVVDDPENSNAITPALVDRDPLVIAIGTEGAAPVLARRIKADLEERLSPSLGALVAAAARFRQRVSNDLPSKLRRALWERFFSDAGLQALGSEAALEAHFLNAQQSLEQPQIGRVTFVGGGAGQADLLTLRARKALHQADVIVHDADISREILELARRESTRFETGTLTAQDSAALMLDAAKSGASVLHLSAAAPLMSGIEHDSLRAAAILVEIIPGVAAMTADAKTNGEEA